VRAREKIQRLRSERAQIDGQLERAFDLLRYCRDTLHQQELISDDEFASLVARGSVCARRLETYDEHEARIKALSAEVERLQKTVGAYCMQDPVSRIKKLEAEVERLKGVWSA
jgi:uncharacterized small protein (DUF1192 family)